MVTQLTLINCKLNPALFPDCKDNAKAVSVGKLEPKDNLHQMNQLLAAIEKVDLKKNILKAL